MTKRSIEDRFRAKVGAPTAAGCTEWTAHKTPNGYGQFGIGKRVVTAPRAAWMLAHGDPGDDQVLHLCGNPACVNIAHLALQGHVETLADLLSHTKFDKATGCMIWSLGRTPRGYSVVAFAGKQRRAHRVAFFLAHGTIGNGLHVCHRCDVPACVNPDHLFTGTHSENMRDKIAKGRGNNATGDRHGSHTHPERVAMGERNGSRTHPEKIMRGERVHGARLTAIDVAEIRASEESYSALGRRFGVDSRTVRDAAVRKTWKHVT